MTYISVYTHICKLMLVWIYIIQLMKRIYMDMYINTYTYMYSIKHIYVFDVEIWYFDMFYTSNSSSSAVLVAQSYLTLCDPMDCIPPGSSVYGTLQARILEWVAIPFSMGASKPRDWTWISCIEERFFTIWVTGKSPHKVLKYRYINIKV